MSTITAAQRRRWEYEDATPAQLRLLEQLQREMEIRFDPWPDTRLDAHSAIERAFALKAERLAPAH